MQPEGPVGRLTAIWRYPVKSLGGEALSQVDVDQRGLVGDRAWALVNAEGKLGSGKETGRFTRIPGLLMASAHSAGEAVWVARGGETFSADDPELDARLSAWFDQPLTLRPEGEVPHFDDGPVSLITSSALAQLSQWLSEEPVDPRRFRANLLIDTDQDGFPEDAWLRRKLAFAGGLCLEVTARLTRCAMVNMETAALAADPRLLRLVAERHEECFGVVARVITPGRLSLGTPVWLG